MSVLSSIIGFLLKLAEKVVAPVAIFFAGRKSVEAEIDKNDAEILEKQRDVKRSSIKSVVDRLRNNGL